MNPDRAMNIGHYSLAFLGIVAGIAACRAGDSTPAPSGPNLIEFRLVEDMPSEGSQEAILNEERLNLGSKPVISDADVDAIAPEIRSGRLLLSIHLNEEGQQKLRRVTAENIGRRMAFILDGQVRSAPVIRESISGDPVDVSVEVSPSEAEILMTKIRSRWEDLSSLARIRGTEVPSLFAPIRSPSTMDIPRIFTITESAHRIHNPITPEKLATLGAALRLESGARVLDLGSGSGEMLCTWARDHGVVGTGIDMSQLFTEQARLRAEELGVAHQVTFIHGDAAGYVSDEKVDVAACVGATWIGGGAAGTLELLARVVEMVLGDQDGWDRYEAAKWLTMRRWLEAHPDDELAEEVRARLISEPERYAAYTREYVGWGVFALMPR